MWKRKKEVPREGATTLRDCRPDRSPHNNPAPPSLFCPALGRGLSLGQVLAVILHIVDARGWRRPSPETDASDLRLCQSVRKQECLRGKRTYPGISQETLQLPGILLVPGVGDCGRGCGHGAFSSVSFSFPFFVHYQCSVRLESTAGSGTCSHSETVLQQVSWPSPKHRL